MSTVSLSPTRQQLDELEELLQRVLALPAFQEQKADGSDRPKPLPDQARQADPTEAVVAPVARPSYRAEQMPAARPTEEAQAPEFRDPSADDWVKLAATWQPSSQTWGPLAETWKQSARPAPPAFIYPMPRGLTVVHTMSSDAPAAQVPPDGLVGTYDAAHVSEAKADSASSTERPSPSEATGSDATGFLSRSERATLPSDVTGSDATAFLSRSEEATLPSETTGSDATLPAIAPVEGSQTTESVAIASIPDNLASDEPAGIHGGGLRHPANIFAWPILAFNQAFDAILSLFGPLGQWLKGQAGRNLLGGIGLCCLVLAASALVADYLGCLEQLWGWLGDWFGWTR